MVVLADEKRYVLVQGITGREGSFHTKLMIEYGTKIVAGVTPGKGGLNVLGVPVYDSVENALKKHPEINSSIVLVPAPFTLDAVYEAIDNGIKLIVIITEHIPLHDEVKLVHYAKKHSVIIIGPNTPGIISPSICKIGIMPASAFSKGSIGIISRSGTLTYEVAYSLAKAGFGQTTAIGIGGDPIAGLTLLEAAELFEEDEETKAIVVIGEIGGVMEEELAKAYAKGKISKPIVAYIAGKYAPPGKRMGHAGAIITMGMGSYESKIRAFKDAGIAIAKTPYEIPKLVSKVLKNAH